LFDYNEKISLHLRFAIHFYLSSFSLDLNFYYLSIFLVSVGTGHGFLSALFGVADLLLQVVFLVLFLFFLPRSTPVGVRVLSKIFFSY
jgi:hypothetical protein